jgi:hypothetical protein
MVALVLRPRKTRGIMADGGPNEAATPPETVDSAALESVALAARKAKEEERPIDPHPYRTFVAHTWPALVLMIVILVVAAVFHNDLAIPSVARGCIVFIVGSGLLYVANKAFFPSRADRGDSRSVRFVIAFDSVLFIIVGLSATILACDHWEVASLLAGACLLIGGFFGLLFGYPQGVAQQATASKPGDTNPPIQNKEKNLVAESAATLGKVLTGFTLAKLGTVSGHFWNLCHTLGPALGGQDSATSHVLASVILTYFLLTGFLSGILLPSYFMSDFLQPDKM